MGIVRENDRINTVYTKEDVKILKGKDKYERKSTNCLSKN